MGGLLALQAPLNAMLGRLLASPISAGLVSLVVSCTSAIVAYAILGGAPLWRTPPVWLYLAGGLIGATFVVGSLVVVPRLGAASFLACVVLGQLATGLAMDHLGAFGLEMREINPTRLAAVGCVLLGVVLLRLA